MAKLVLDIEVGSNGGYVVTWYKNTPNTIQQFAGIKTDKEVLAFSDTKTLADWIAKTGRY